MLNTYDKEYEINKIINDDYKLLNCKYIEQSNTLRIEILSKYNIENEEKNALILSIKKLINLEINYDIYIKESENEQEIIDEIKNYLSKYKVGDVNLFSNCEIKEVKNLKYFNIYLNRSIDYNDLCSIKNEVALMLENNFFDSLYLNIVQKDASESSNILSKREELLLENVDECCFQDITYNVEDVQMVFGKHITNIAQKISSICKECSDIQVAGTIRFFRESFYKPKNSEENAEEKIRYNFDLIDDTGKISAVIFPPKYFLEKQDVKFEDGQDIIVKCDVNKYNEKFSIKVKELAFCKLPEIKKEETKEEIHDNIEYIKEVNENYKIISPKDYIEQEQINIFSMQKKAPENMLNKEYVVFDLETTGLEPERCEIIEIGAVKIVNGEIVQTFSTLIRPSQDIPEEITNITGISNDMVVFAPALEEVLPDFYKFTRGTVLVAHNASFDTSFLRYHANKNRYNFDNEVEDTLALARQKVKGLKNYKLKTLTEYFNIILVDAHRALNDTVATAKVFIELERLDS